VRLCIGPSTLSAAIIAGSLRCRGSSPHGDLTFQFSSLRYCLALGKGSDCLSLQPPRVIPAGVFSFKWRAFTSCPAISSGNSGLGTFRLTLGLFPLGRDTDSLPNKRPLQLGQRPETFMTPTAETAKVLACCLRRLACRPAVNAEPIFRNVAVRIFESVKGQVSAHGGVESLPQFPVRGIWIFLLEAMAESLRPAACGT